MSGFLESFVMKPYDLEKFMSEWHGAPKFKGKGRDDVDAWLAAIEQRCKECKVPSEYWPRVALSLMSSGARERMDKLKEVLQAIHGSKKYRWNWKQFKAAVKGIEWKIGNDELIKCTLKNGNIFSWKKSEKKEKAPSPPSTPPATPQRQPPKRSNTSIFRRGSTDSATTPPPSPPSTHKSVTSSSRPTPVRKTSDGAWLSIKKSDASGSDRPPMPKRSRTEMIPATTLPAASSNFLSSLFTHAEPEPMEHIETKGVKGSRDSEHKSEKHKSKESKEHKSEHRSRSGSTNEGNEVVEKVEVPVWLLNASTALDYMTGEHPKAMAVLSAILMGAGAVTANPALTAGSAILGSHAAQTIGCVAMAIGQALNASLTKKTETSGEASSHSR